MRLRATGDICTDRATLDQWHPLAAVAEIELCVGAPVDPASISEPGVTHGVIPVC